MDGELEQEIDEHLEALWLCEEKGGPIRVDELLLRTKDGGRREVLDLMEERDLLRIRDGTIEVRPEGRRLAEALARRHRLAERLLTDVLGVVGKDMSDAACQFEHFLSPEVTDSICTLLGHPPTCPHGLAIPAGPCCSRQSTDVKPLVVRLDHCTVGDRGWISLISSRSPDRLRRLGTLGMLPGAAIRVRQRRPVFVVEVGETTIALEREMATEIYVKRKR